MKVLGICTPPIAAAATRYRLYQYIEPLAVRGIELNVLPFLDTDTFARFYQSGNNFSKIGRIISSTLKRGLQVLDSRKYDLVLIQREAMIYGPAIFEFLFQKIGNCPMILDLDDATYISYTSPTYGKIGSLLKFQGKTDNLIKRSERVICGNRFIADYVQNKGKKTIVIPTVVDTEKFFPLPKNNENPVVGWIGTHSTFPFLKKIFPVFEKLGKEYNFTLRIIGAGTDDISIKGVRVENQDWKLESEVKDFQSLDIGLYPITTSESANTDWLKGKSGFKSIQYLAVGIPFIVTPFGVTAEIGIRDKTHFEAVSDDDWYQALKKLISDVNLRNKMGCEGRKFSLQNFTLDLQSEKLADTIRSVTAKTDKR